MKHKQGFIAISAVLIISAVVVSIGITTSLLSIGEGQSALSLTKGENTLMFVEGCMEDALLKIKASASYSGGLISRPEGTCSISVSQTGNTYTVSATTTTTTYKRTIQSVVNRGNSLSISSWKEI